MYQNNYKIRKEAKLYEDMIEKRDKRKELARIIIRNTLLIAIGYTIAIVINR